MSLNLLPNFSRFDQCPFEKPVLWFAEHCKMSSPHLITQPGIRHSIRVLLLLTGEWLRNQSLSTKCACCHWGEEFAGILFHSKYTQGHMIFQSHSWAFVCHPLLLLPSIFPRIRVFSIELALHIRWPKDWSFSFSISPSDEYLGLISFKIDWFDLLAVQGTLKSLLQHHNLKSSILWHLAFFMVQLSHSYITTGKSHSFDLCRKVMSLLFNTQSRFLWCSDSKESVCNAEGLGLMPRLGRSPGGGHGNPLQNFSLENPNGQRSLAGYSP